MVQQNCFICIEKEAKYTCPACGARTCSAECVKRHKLRSECSGQVDPTKFVARKDISSNPSLINRDYNYLMNLERKIELSATDVKKNAKAMFRRPHGNMNKRQRIDTEDQRALRVNKKYNSPAYSIKRENVLVVNLSAGMSRALQNKSGYDKKAGTYSWTVEWIPVGGDLKPAKSSISYRIKEELTLQEAVPIAVLASSLGVDVESIETDKLHFYLENVLSTGKKSVIALNAQESLATALKNKVVLEFPQIYVTFSAGTFREFVEEEKEAYGLESELESSSDSSDSSSDLSSDSDSEDSDSDSDEAPEEDSSKAVPEEAPKNEEDNSKLNEALQPIEITQSQVYEEDEGFSA